MFKKLAITTKINFEKELNNETKTINDFRRVAIFLPIKKIDNINVRVIIDVFRNFNKTNYGMDLKITTAFDIEYDEDFRSKTLYDKRIHMKTKQFELEDYETGFMQLYELLPKLKMNKLKNSFDTEIHLDDEELTLLCNHTNTETNECCVCKELTGDSFIRCKHVLCIECFGNLKHTHNADEDSHAILCPMCRFSIGN